MTSVKQIFLHLSLIAVAATVAFANTLDNGFIYDDHLQILDNPWLRDPSHLTDIFTNEVWGFTDYSASDYYRPLMHSLNLLIYILFGPDRIAFHTASLLLHLGCCVLFYLVCRELLAERDLAETGTRASLPLLAAMLFAVYPGNTEAVAWLGSSADLLYVLFCLAAWLCWMHGVPVESTPRPWLFICSLNLFMAATLSKETAFLFPLLLLVVDGARGYLAASGFWPRLRRCHLPFIGVAALSLAIRFAVLGSVKPITHSMTIEVTALLRAFAWYLKQLFWPFQHNFYAESATLAGTGDLSAIIMPLLVLGLSGTLIIAFRRVRLLWVVLALVVLPLLPALANSALGMPVAERYLYLSGAGFCLFLAWAAFRFLKHERMRVAMVALLMVSFAGASFMRNTQFQNDLTIWEDTIRISPNSAKALGWHATALLVRGRLDEGIARTGEAIELGLKSGNNLYDLAQALEESGRGQETVRYFERVLELHPGDAEAYFEVGRTYHLLGQNEQAISALEKALELQGDYPLALIALGRALVASGNESNALALFEQAVRLDPEAYPALREEMVRLSAKSVEQ